MDRPILFSGPMVRALLEGRKTETRRIIKGHPHALKPLAVGCPYGGPGDRLWVKETFTSLHHNGVRWVYRADGEDPRSGWDDVPAERRPKMKWHSSLYMPRRLSRITLEVTSVHVEQLHDLTEAGAKAEGVTDGIIPATGDHPALLGHLLGDDDGRCTLYPTRCRAFEVGWDHLNAERAPWAENPWVWVVRFEVVDALRRTA